MKQKKISLTKKQKGWIIGGAALLGATAIITPISVVISQKMHENDWPEMVDQFDKAFDVSLNTYEDMKDELRFKYKLSLEDEWYPENVVEEKINELEEDIAAFDDDVVNMYTDGDEPIDYVAITKVFEDYALEKYNIVLERPSNITSQDIYDFYSSMKESFILDLRNNKHLGTAEIIERVTSVETRYYKIIAQLEKKYPNDALSAYIEGTTLIIECFAAEDELAALISAEDRLKQFLESYAISFRTDTSITKVVNTYESDLVQGLELNQPISATKMNQIFEFTEKTSQHKVAFSNDIIPNYTIVPVLHSRYMGDNNPDKVVQSVNASNFSNTYILGIDWQVWSNLYLEKHKQVANDANAMKRVVAHLRGNNPNISEGSTPADEIQAIEDSEIVYTEYNILANEETEKKNMIRNFFTTTQTNAVREVPQFDVKFIWPSNPNDVHYEAFWDGVKPSDGTETTAEIDEQALASAGLHIKVDKIGTDNLPIEVGVETPLVDIVKDETSLWQKADIYLTNEQLFVKYCLVGGIVTLPNYPIAQSDDSFQVTTKLFAKYRNNDDENFDSSCYMASDDQKVIKAKISDEFFSQAADNYNKTVRKYAIYFDPLVMIGLNETFLKYSFSVAVTVAYNALAIASTVLVWKVKLADDPEHKIIYALLYCLLIVNCVAVAAEAILWIIYYFIPMINFDASLVGFALDPAFSALKSKIDTDELIFPKRNSDGIYEEDDFQSHKKVFIKKITEDGFVSARTKYCDFYSNAVKYSQDPKTPIDPLIKNFDTAAKKHGCSFAHFLEVLNQFDEGQRVFEIVGYFEDVKLIVSTCVEWYTPKLDDDAYVKILKNLGKSASKLKIAKISIGDILSGIKCDSLDRWTQEFKK